MSWEASEANNSEWARLSKTEKHGLAGRRTAERRAARTNDAILIEVLRALHDGEVVTQASVAKAAGIGERRVQQLWASSVGWSEPEPRSYQVFSPGGATQARHTDSLAAPTLKQIAATSRERAAQVAAERAAISAYEAQAMAMRKPYPSGQGRGGRGSGGLDGVLGGLVPVPGQQFVQAGCGVVVDPAQHVSQPGARVGVVQLGGDDERIHRRGPVAATV